MPTSMLCPACITTASTMLHRQSTDPTDRSMPPVMMTTVMPSAMIATKVTLRVMLYKFFVVANESVATDRKTDARMTAINTQNVWLPRIVASQLCCFRSIAWSKVSVEIAIADLCFLSIPTGGIDYTRSIAPVISPVTSSGELAAI